MAANKEVEEAIALLESGQVSRKGRVYDVELDVNHEDLLDWDLPLSEQPEKVREALSPIVGDLERAIDAGSINVASRVRERMRGEQIYGLLGMSLEGSNRAGRDVSASRELMKAGIPGLRYLDAGSRAGEEGTRNVVMFPGAESLIKITGRK